MIQSILHGELYKGQFTCLCTLVLLFLANTVAIADDATVTGTQRSVEPVSIKSILTEQEQAWLKKHPTIIVGSDPGFPPYSFREPGGQYLGLAPDYLQQIETILGIQFRIIEQPGWTDALTSPYVDNVDVIATAVKTAKREESFLFTESLMPVTEVIITRGDDTTLRTPNDLNDRTLALVRDFAVTSQLISEYTNIKGVFVDSTLECLQAVSERIADACVASLEASSYLIKQNSLTNLKFVTVYSTRVTDRGFAIRKDWPELAVIMGKVLATIPAVQRQVLYDKWVDVEYTPSVARPAAIEFLLKPEERRWLDQRPTVRLGVDNAWPPIEWLDDKGRYQGMSSEYIDYISNMLGLYIAPAERIPWSVVLEKAQRGEIDMIPSIVATEERRKYLNFTSPYQSYPFVIFTRDDAPLVTELRDLYDMRVAVEENYAAQEYLQRDHPKIRLITYKTTEEILRALSLGRLDAYVGNLTVAGYLINKMGLSNLKVAAPTPYNYELSIGVRKDLPELLSIMESSLSMIDEKQRNDIRQKWLKLDYEVGVDYTLVKQTVIAAVVVILITLTWMAYVQRQKRILSAAKAETDRVNEAYHLANNQLISANLKLKELDRMKSMFIASISHELRTPLNSIIGFSSMMLHGSFGDLNEKYQDYTRRINNSGQHLLSLISDIIDISKIEAGRADISLSDFELSEIVLTATEAMSQQIEHKGLSLELNVPQGLTMHTDRQRLFQCLLNFLSNAIKYTEHGGIILTAKEQEEAVVLSIRDSGIGISEEDLPRLFEPFERMESHLQVKAGGTGLGLYLTRKIATELLQGEVGVESQLGEGSLFWIKVPKTINGRAVIRPGEKV